MTGRHAATAPMYQLYRLSVNFKRLYSHTLGGKAIIWSCRRRSTRVSPCHRCRESFVTTQFAASCAERPHPPPPPQLPPPPVSVAFTAAGTLYIVNKMSVDVVFSIFPRGTKDTCSQLSRHWSVTGQSSINRSRTFRIDPSEKIG